MEAKTVPRKYEFRGAVFRLEPEVVRLDNDVALSQLLRGKKPAARRLARQILREYRSAYGRELRITEGSLAAEIWYHYRFHVLFLRLRKLKIKNRLLSRLLRSTETIDMGERARDNNRLLWDLLGFFW